MRHLTFISICGAALIALGGPASANDAARDRASIAVALFKPAQSWATRFGLGAAAYNDGFVRASAAPGHVAPLPPGRPILHSFDAVSDCAEADLEIERRLVQIDELESRPRMAKLERFWRASYVAPKSVALGQPVPPLFLERVPADMNEDLDVARKKRGFVLMMLPHILQINAEIAAERAAVKSMLKRIDSPGGVDLTELDWLTTVFEKYGVEPFDAETLLARIDAIPPALAIAQAAKETGWGSSRFAQAGNAMYGQWTWDPSHKGIVPRNRSAGKTHRVRAFDSLLDATRAYALNINTHGAYGKLRELRRELRRRGRTPTGIELSRALDKYAEIGKRYGKALRRIIQRNSLTRLNDARLGPSLDEPAPAAEQTDAFRIGLVDGAALARR